MVPKITVLMTSDLFVSQQCECKATPPSTCGAASTMEVGEEALGRLVADDTGHPLQVHPPSHAVRAEEQLWGEGWCEGGGEGRGGEGVAEGKA